MSWRSKFHVAAATTAVTACVSLVGVQSALAGASPKASCIGIEASDISPPGSSEEFPGGMPELTSVVRDLSEAFGVPPGAIISPVAKVHAGSHQACDEAE